MDVCQKCGDKGDKKRLVHCIKCQLAAEHSYCFDTLPRNGDKNIIWTCEECIPRDAKSILEPSIRSARISQAVEIKLRRIKMLRRMGFSTVHSQPCTDADRLTNSQPKRDSSCLTEQQPSSQITGNEDSLKPKRRLVIEGGSSDEDSQSVKCTVGDPPQFVHNAYPLNMSNSDTRSHVHAHPVVDPIWRGCLRIQNNNNATIIGVVAHLSSKCCAKVKDSIKELPMLLNAAIFPRCDVWPWKFQIEQPTDECIAVYLFPEHERDEKHFDHLMNGMIIHDQALKVVMKTVQLFVFSSRQLPSEHWRFCRKYYLWGVFKSA
ncbi:PHD finger-containing protein 1-like [Euphorbia lathyris]|uniref:PHD finger-containing protein 1-like n=1 Tax=Euphorbia lathyris TaxID=212925 RepID=UPI003313C7FF